MAGWQTAAVELGKLGETEVLPDLIKALARSEHHKPSGEIIDLLSSLMNSETLDDLIAALGDPEKYEAEPYFLNKNCFLF